MNLFQNFSKFFYDPSIQTSIHPVSLLQTKLKCCGINFKGVNEWQEKNSSFWKESVENKASCLSGCVHVPDTCCREVTPGCGLDLKNTTAGLSKIWEDGCIHNLSYEVLDQVGTLAGAAIVICLIELSGIMMSCCFWKQIHGSKYDTF